MNLSEIKQNLISLGFGEESDIEEYDALGYVNDSINRAISIISNSFPYIQKAEVTFSNKDSGIAYVDMSENVGFLDFATETPVMYEKAGENVFKRFNDYDIEMDTIVVIDSTNLNGSIRIYYEKQCTQITDETQADFVPEIPLKAHHLIPLLAAYYLWLDDDQVKATQYYNMYETELSMLLQKAQRPRMRILDGGL